MIQPNELRIGNFINKDGVGFIKVGFSTFVHLNSYPITNDQYNPITLTEQVLIDCGYERFYLSESDPLRGLKWMRNKNSVCHGAAGPKAPYGGFVFQLLNGITFNSADRIEVAYLHQLQNLVFALTGEELNVQLSEPKVEK